MKECDEQLRAALLNIDKVGWKIAREHRAVFQAAEALMIISFNYNHISKTMAQRVNLKQLV